MGFWRWAVAFAITGVSVRAVQSIAGEAYGFAFGAVILLGVFMLQDRGQYHAFMAAVFGGR